MWKFRTQLWTILCLTALLPTSSRAIVAGAAPDSPNNPYNPLTQTGRLDTLGLASPFSGVGSIFGGSGTLLDSTHVLTAAHLFDTNPSAQAVTFNLSYNDGSGTANHAFGVSQYTINPSYHGVNGNDSYDLAIVTLSTAVPVSVQTYGLYTGALTAGTTVTLVGYGQTGSGSTGYAAADGNRRVGQNVVDAYATPSATVPGGFDGHSTYQPGDQTYLFDFDGPTTSTPNYLGGTSLGNDVETTIGVGDSGGPAFVLVNGRYQIAAINNFTFQFANADGSAGPTAGLFGTGGGGAIVSAYTNFIYSVVPAPVPEPAPAVVLGLGALLLAGGAAYRRTRSQV